MLLFLLNNYYIDYIYIYTSPFLSVSLHMYLLYSTHNLLILKVIYFIFENLRKSFNFSKMVFYKQIYIQNTYVLLQAQRVLYINFFNLQKKGSKNRNL